MQQALTYLLTDPLKHLVHLKYLHHYGEMLTCHHVEGGVLLSYPTQSVFWDAQTYPTSQHIILLTASNPTAASLLLDYVLDHYPLDAPLVIKFGDDWLKTTFARAFRLDFQRALLSYTSPPNTYFNPAPDVTISATPDPRCVDLYVTNGYTRDELAGYFAAGAQSYTIYADDEPICTCIAYPNYENIWEIAALNTVAHARRQGHARRVVQSALHTLTNQGKTPRYAVLETNTASIQLAESLGLVRFMRFQHYLATRL